MKLSDKLERKGGFLYEKEIFFYAIATVLALGLTVTYIWYHSPKTFLKGVSADEVASISVFNGSTGKSMILDDPDVIRTIVDNIQGIEMKRDKLSVQYDGFSFRASFQNADGKTIDSFIINSDDTIRDDPFFYRCESGILCYDYLKELENLHSGE